MKLEIVPVLGWSVGINGDFNRKFIALDCLFWHLHFHWGGEKYSIDNL